MSNTYGRPTGATDSRPTFPKVKAEIGEDPARYLHDPDQTAWARIRGIQCHDVLDAWIRVEEELGPRQNVMKRLNQRRAELRDQHTDEEDDQ